MDFPERYKEEGFLSIGTTNGIASVRAENADWFKLAEDTNVALMRTAIAATSAMRTIGRIRGPRR